MATRSTGPWMDRLDDPSSTGIISSRILPWAGWVILSKSSNPLLTWWSDHRDDAMFFSVHSVYTGLPHRKGAQGERKKNHTLEEHSKHLDEPKMAIWFTKEKKNRERVRGKGDGSENNWRGRVGRGGRFIKKFLVWHCVPEKKSSF